MEAAGYDTLMTAETAHDAFVRAAVMAEHTAKAEIMTSIAVAFARTPMLLAMAGHDLNALSRGRFAMGIGSQVKAHVARRFSMPWSHPAARMREMIAATQAIWDCWYDGKPLKFEGAFYNHTLMTPYFTPTDTEYGRPTIHLAAVGELMTQVAGELADGMICHSFTTERYLREVTLPTLKTSLMKRGRERRHFELTYAPFVAVGDSEADRAESVREVKSQIAFYGSTPSYRGVLDLHGWGALHEALNRLSKRGEWERMTSLIDDEVLDSFAVVGPADRVISEIGRRYGGLIDRLGVNFDEAGAALPELLRALKALPA